MAQGNDVRLAMGDVALVRNAIKVSHASSTLFKSQLVIPTLAIGTVTVGRAFNQMDVTKQGITVHVVNTHLEAFSPQNRLDQANWNHDGDWIMTKPALTLVKSYTVGTETTAAGIHPGDHGGVVSVIKITG